MEANAACGERPGAAGSRTLWHSCTWVRVLLQMLKTVVEVETDETLEPDVKKRG